MLRSSASNALVAACKAGSARCNVRSCRGFHATALSQALSKFTMPAMSPTMTEGGLSSWKKQEGDTFAPGDVLLEIETDKASMDVEAQDEGKVVKILVGDGSKNVQVGSLIAIMAEEGDEVDQSEVDKLAAEGGEEAESSGDKGADSGESSKPAEKSESKPAEKSESAPAKDSAEMARTDAPKSSPPSPDASTSSGSSSAPRDRIVASPIAKSIALEKGIPLGKIKGSGPNGRIVKADVEAYKPEAAAPAPSPSASSPAPAKKSGASQPSPSAKPPSSESTTPPYTDTPVSSMRRVIASRLTESYQQAPHYFVTGELTMDRLLKLREVFNQAAAAGGRDGVKAGMKLSVNDFIVKAVALACQDVPEVNASWMGDSIRQYHRQDISIAVSTPTGLITPIVADAGSKGLAAISTLSKELAKKARDGKLQPHEYQGGSFTISNMGMFGSVHSFTAIINAPQSAILAVSGTEDKLVLDPESERGFRASKVMKVTVDHRTVDGATAARWMSALKSVVENPLALML